MRSTRTGSARRPDRDVLVTRIVRDDGFHPDDLAAESFVTVAELDAAAAGGICLHLAGDASAQEVTPYLQRIAMRLRQLGFAGRLRAEGHIIADQYLMARRSGFDEVAISDELAARQPEEHWQNSAGKLGFSYQDRVAVNTKPAES